MSGARHPAGGGPKPDPRPRGRAPTLAGPGGLAPRVRDASHRDAAAVSQSRRKFPDSCPHHAAPLCGRRSSSGNKALQTVTGAGAPLPARAPQAVKSTVKSRAASEPGAPAAAHRGVGPRLPPPPARGRSTWTPSRSWPAGPQVWEGVASRRRSRPRGGPAPPRGGPAPPRGHALPPGPPWSRARPRPPKPRQGGGLCPPTGRACPSLRLGEVTLTQDAENKGGRSFRRTRGWEGGLALHALVQARLPGLRPRAASFRAGQLCHQPGWETRLWLRLTRPRPWPPVVTSYEAVQKLK